MKTADPEDAVESLWADLAAGLFEKDFKVKFHAQNGLKSVLFSMLLTNLNENTQLSGHW